MTAGDEAAGEAVLRRAVAVAVDELGPALDAAFALGSLAHGGFAPLVSDVDLMLVLTTVDGSAASVIAQIGDRVRRAGGTELADRLSVFWSDWPGVRVGVGTHGRLPEVDRVDLLDSGRLLHGTDRRAGAQRPATATLVRQAAEFAVAAFDRDHLVRLGRPAELVGRGPRPVTKAVLFPVRFLYTLATGRIGHNEHAARWFAAHSPHRDLVTAALTWRVGGIIDAPAAERLLAQHLVPIWSSFAAEYVRSLDAQGERALAARVAAWAEPLG